MSVIAGPLSRALWSLILYIRTAALRATVASVVTLALAGAAALYALRASLRRGASGGGTGAATSAGTARPRRLRGTDVNSTRPRGLTGVRRVTIGCEVLCVGDASASSAKAAAPDVLFAAAHESGPDSAVSMRKSVLPYLKRLAKLCDLYIITRVASDAVEEAVRAALREEGVFAAGMDERKALFCETAEGRVSIVRQLEPHLHIDASGAVIGALQRFIKYVAIVAPAEGEEGKPEGSNVLKFDSLEAFWTKQ